MRRTSSASAAALLVTVGLPCAARAVEAPPAQQLSLEQRLRVTALKPESMEDMLQRMSEISYTRWVGRGESTQPFTRLERKVGQIHYLFEGQSYTVDELFTRVLSTGMVVLHDGKLVYERYRPGSDAHTHFMSYSVGKSITAMLIGAALEDGSITSLDDLITKYVPALKGTAYEAVTIKNGLQMSSGVRFSEAYTEPSSEIAQLTWHSMIARDQPFIEQVQRYQRVAPPGTVFNYSTAEAQVMGLVVSGATHRELASYLEERIWSQIGMEHDAALLLDLPRGTDSAGFGYLATVRDFARLGQLMLQDGLWNGKRILAQGWVREATIPTAPQDGYGKLPWGGSAGYGYMWYALPGPDRAYVAEGIRGQMIYVNPAKKVVIARTSAWRTAWDQHLEQETWAAFEAIGKQLSRQP